MPYSIMMDAGHGGRDPGAVYEGRQEKDDALRLALAVGGILQDNGIDVSYTRTTDVYETPFQKAMEANAAGVELFISIHRNSFPEANGAFGVESLVYDLSGLKYEIAQSVDRQLETVGFQDLGVKARPNLVVLKRTKMPAVLVEVGFLNSDTDNRIFDENFRDIALAIADGILDVLRSRGLIPENGARTENGNGAENGNGTPGAGTGLSEPENGTAREREAQTAAAIGGEGAADGKGIAGGEGTTGGKQTAGGARDEGDESGRDAVSREYHIQVGSFRNRRYAERLQNELMEQDYPAYIEEGNGYIRVQVGDYTDLNEAAEMERRLKRAGYQTLLVRE